MSVPARLSLGKTPVDYLNRIPFGATDPLLGTKAGLAGALGAGWPP